jgi:CRISPR/Cas system CSM-associated protein Csm2 small subunit
MTIPWQSMTAEEFAQFRSCLGEDIIPANGTFWQRIRPCFYRPLLPYQEYPPQSVSGPGLAFFGGFQHAIPPDGRATSFMNLLLFEDLKSYSLGGLDRHERRQIKRAAEAFTVSLVTDVNEFKAQAYTVYRSFYERTKYNYKAERQHEGNFTKWAEVLYQYPKVIVLGAYDKNRELGAIGVWHLVDDTLIYSTFFCDTKSLKMHVTGLMLHTVRDAAAGCQAIKQIFRGYYKNSGAKSVDDFYFARGCKLVRKPAWLQLNPLIAFGLKRFAPEQYGRLIGDLQVARVGAVNEPGTSSGKPGTGAISGEAKAAESGRVMPPAARG